MGHILSIPAVVKEKRQEIILEPEKNLGELIREYIGTEAEDMYYSFLRNDIREEVEHYRNDLISIKEDIGKLLEKSKVTRKGLQDIYDEICDRLQS